jgi:hypothetical protein
MQAAFDNVQPNHVSSNDISAAIRRASSPAKASSPAEEVITAKEWYDHTTGAADEILRRIGGGDLLRTLREESLQRTDDNSARTDNAKFVGQYYRELAAKLHAALMENAPLIAELAAARAAEAESAKSAAEAEAEAVAAYREMHKAASEVRAAFAGDISLPAVPELPANNYREMESAELNRRASRGDVEARAEQERRRTVKAQQSVMRRVK